jgi:glycosyltransferase involved in cell wall biosynthesis
MKFSIITSCFNAEKYISETIKSVCEQTEIINGNCELEYIIIDGNSTDNTNLIIEEHKKKYPRIVHIIEKDEGLYDGLSKGFKKVSGDVMGYLNAGDFLNKSAFSVLKNVFSNKKISWATGLKVLYNQKSEVTNVQIPYNYRSNLIRCGAYGKYLPFIQQESTFWRPNLLKDLDIDFFKSLKRSGDMYLWFNFAKKNKLYIINSYLSGFKYHDNQLTFKETGSTDVYLNESKKFINKIKFIDLFYIIVDSIFWFLGRNVTSIFRKLNPRFIDYFPNEDWVKKNIKEPKVYCWASDFDNTNGEGITANLFIKKLIEKNNYKDENIVVLNIQKKINFDKIDKFKDSDRRGKLNLIEKYFDPIYGIFYLWVRYLLGNRVVFVNFLPLWNFVTLALLPPNTILGPITGTSSYDKNLKGLEKIFRKYLMPLQFIISNQILKYRYKNLIFNTSNLKTILSKKVINKSNFNFIYNLYDLNKSETFIEKKYDFIFYIRRYPSKGIEKTAQFIEILKEDFNIITVGEKLNINGIEEFGFISREKVLNLCKKSKFSIISSENFYSLFCFDCISNGVKVFFNEMMKHEKIFVEDKKAYPINFNNFKNSIEEITRIAKI